MTAFAIFYEDADRAAIAAQLTRQDLPPAIKAEAAKYWDGGFRNYMVCPFAPYDRLPGFTLVIDGPDVDVAGLVALLRSIAAEFPNDEAANYMDAIAGDLEPVDENGFSSSRIEPWTG